MDQNGAQCQISMDILDMMVCKKLISQSQIYNKFDSKLNDNIIIYHYYYILLLLLLYLFTNIIFLQNITHEKKVILIITKEIESNIGF